MPIVKANAPLVYGNAVKDIAQCSSTGFRPHTVGVIWILGNYSPETDNNPAVVEIGTTNIFTVTSYYNTAVRREDNGKILTCQVNHTSLATPLSGSLQLNILCMLIVYNSYVAIQSLKLYLKRQLSKLYSHFFHTCLHYCLCIGYTHR